MITRQQYVDEARSWLGTRFVKGQRRKGVAIDCALPLVVIEDLTGKKLDTPELRSLRQYGKSTIENVFKRCYVDGVPIVVDTPEIGDIAAMFFDRRTKIEQHVAIKTDIGILHCMEQTGVVEHDFNINWEKKVVRWFKNPIASD